MIRFVSTIKMYTVVDNDISPAITNHNIVNNVNIDFYLQHFYQQLRSVNVHVMCSEN